jgi:hypothetical protein
VNSLKYHIFLKMQCDIKAFPITTVASKSAFSVGSRIIDPYWASISTETVQMLLCVADWEKTFFMDFKKTSKVIVTFMYLFTNFYLKIVNFSYLFM